LLAYNRLPEAIELWKTGMDNAANIVSDDKTVLLSNLALGLRVSAYRHIYTSTFSFNLLAF
jgi:hypothetical protein